VLVLIESLMADAIAFTPEYLMFMGLPELPRRPRPKFIIIRQPVSRRV
jgi:hypothetical protein